MSSKFSNKSSPFIQLSLDFDPRQERFIDSRGVTHIYIGSGHFGGTRHYISSDGFPYTLHVKTSVFRKGSVWCNIAPALKARGSKVRAYPYMRHKHRTCYVHRIVAQYFLNGGQPIPPGYQVDHLDGNIFNNAVSNLEIVTTAENYRRRNERHHYKTMTAHAREGSARQNRKRYARIHDTLAAQQAAQQSAAPSA